MTYPANLDTIIVRHKVVDTGGRPLKGNNVTAVATKRIWATDGSLIPYETATRVLADGTYEFELPYVDQDGIHNKGVPFQITEHVPGSPRHYFVAPVLAHGTGPIDATEALVEAPVGYEVKIQAGPVTDAAAAQLLAQNGQFAASLKDTIGTEVEQKVATVGVKRSQISDATQVGRDLLAASSSSGVRNFIGLGTNDGYPFTPTVRGWITASGDANTYMTSNQAGTYGLANTAANAPEGMGAFGTLTLSTDPSSGRLTQWVTAPGGSWWRVGQTTSTTTTWQPWNKVPTPDDVATTATTAATAAAQTAAAQTASGPGLRQINWLTSFAPGHGWTRSGTTGTVSDDPSLTVMGSNALLLDTGTDSTVTANLLSTSIDLSSSMLGLWVHVEDWSKLSSILVYASNSATMGTQWWAWRIADGASNHPWFKDGEWVYVNLPFPGDHTMGSTTPPTRSEPVRAVRVRVAGTGARVRLGAVGTQPDRHPAFPHGVVTITFDDGYDSTLYRAARLSMTPRGWAGSVAAIPETVGNPGFMTLDEYYELKHVHGWDVEAHNVAEATSLTDEELRIQWAGDQEWAKTNGLGPSRHLIWPRGLVDKRTARIASEFFDTARTIDYLRHNGLETLPPAMPYRMRSQSVMQAAPAIDVLNRAAEYGQWAILTFHRVSADADWTADGLTVSQSDFDAICDHIATLGMPVRTLDQVWRAIT